MPKIKLGLIGCGKQASKHIASLKKIPDVKLILSDIRQDAAKELANKEGLEWVHHPDSILADNTIQAVIICTPTPSHVSLIKSALVAEKDVFCEKPLCDSMEESAELQKLCMSSKRIVMIGYIYRFVPIFEEGYRLFREHRIKGDSITFGRPLSAFFRLGGRGDHQAWKHKKETNGGAINEMLVHMIDLAYWYFGPIQKTEVISCDLRYPERFINGEKVKVNAEDYIMVRCFGKNNIEIFCQADLITPAFSQFVEIQGENGTFMGSIQENMPSYVFLKESRGGYSAGKTELNYGHMNILDIQMMAFVKSVLKKEPPDRNTSEDSSKLLKIMNEIRKQVEV